VVRSTSSTPSPGRTFFRRAASEFAATLRVDREAPGGRVQHEYRARGADRCPLDEACHLTTAEGSAPALMRRCA